MGMYIKKSRTILVPEEYQEVEYLQSTGTQYIDTGWLYDSTKLPITIKYEFEYVSFTGGSAGNNMAICGLQSSSYSNWIYPTYNAAGSSSIVSYIGNASKKAFYTASLNTTYEIEITLTSDTVSRKCTSNGTSILEDSYSYSPTIDTESSLYVFAGSYGNQVVDKSKIKLYSLSIDVNDGTLVRNLIPCYNENDVAGMYDLVNDIFYTNQGVGDDFTVGPDLLDYELIQVSSSIDNLLDRTVTFKVDDSKYQIDSVKSGCAVYAPTVDPTKTGYYFNYWCEDLSNPTELSFPYTPTSDKTLYAYLINRTLPDEYQEVEYIEATGTQYIDTGITLSDSNFKYDLSFMPTNTIGAIIGNQHNNTMIYRNNSLIELQYFGYNNKISWPTDEKKTIVASYQSSTGMRKFKLDDNEISYTAQLSVNSETIKIFANTGYIPGDNGHGKLYYCNLLQNNIFVRCFVPCYKKENNEPGLYDLVNSVFYTDAAGSSTKFTVGPDVD